VINGYQVVLAALVALISVVATSFGCSDVSNHAEMASMPRGFPLTYIFVDMQRYTPIFFPETFCGLGSPWEDSRRIMWVPFFVNIALISSLILAVTVAFNFVRKKQKNI